MRSPDRLRRALVEGRLHRVDDQADLLGDRLADLLDDTTTVFGRPLTRSRPRISACGSSADAHAEPMAIFTSSAVRSPSDERVLLLGVRDDRLVELVAADPCRLAGDDAAASG